VALALLALVLAAAAGSRALGYGALAVAGGSMGDSIPNGSLVFGRWVTADELEAGDVVLIQEQREDGPAAPRMHRIVALQDEGGNTVVRTKGDANDAADPTPYVLPERVLTPAYRLPYLGFLLALVSTTAGWLLLIALPGAGLCLFTLRSIWLSGRGPPRELATAK
jgi:signal peptidase I